MITFRTLVALLIAALMTAVAVAQIDAARKPDLAKPAIPVTIPPTAHESAERTEDVEVLRRILNKSLGLPNQQTAALLPATGFGSGMGAAGFGGNVPNGVGITGGGAGFSGMYTQMTYSASPFNGVSLPGYGAVYTLRIPANTPLVLNPPTKAVGLAGMCRKCHDSEPVSREVLEPGADVAKLTEWDRTRQELHGAKPTGKQPQAATRLTRQQICEPGNMTERIVEKLWQNIKHVRHLAPTDHLTVAITFDGLIGSAKDRQTLDPSTEWQNRFQPTERKGPQPNAQAGFTADESQQLALGDLHLKQGKPHEAAEAYGRALARYKNAVERWSDHASVPPENARKIAEDIQKSVRAVYRRLAQAWLAAGDVEKGQAALDMARKFTFELADATKEKAMTMPAKLIISVTRADAEKAGSDLQDFRKAVKVETIGFPPADKKK